MPEGRAVAVPGPGEGAVPGPVGEEDQGQTGEGPGWYDWQTALRLVQTYGRSMRSDTDHAVTYVLDSNFPQFVRRHGELFPEYFMEALVDSRGV